MDDGLLVPFWLRRKTDCLPCLCTDKDADSGSPHAGKKAYTKTIVRPRADQLTSTFTSAQLAYRYGFPILQEKSNRRARAVLHQCRVLMLHLTAALLAAGDNLLLEATNATG